MLSQLKMRQLYYFFFLQRKMRCDQFEQMLTQQTPTCVFVILSSLDKCNLQFFFSTGEPSLIRLGLLFWGLQPLVRGEKRCFISRCDSWPPFSLSLSTRLGLIFQLGHGKTCNTTTGFVCSPARWIQHPLGYRAEARTSDFSSLFIFCLHLKMISLKFIPFLIHDD